jgi:hypothetical protein
MNRRVIPALMMATALCLTVPLAGLASAHGLRGTASAPKRWTYQGGGWTLALIGTTLSGTFSGHGHSYPVKGDWIPAADAGGDLFRFYGHPYGAKTPLGLVGLATLYNTCKPNCAASKTFTLHEITSPQLFMVSKTLPGMNRPSLTLTLHA